MDTNKEEMTREQIEEEIKSLEDKYMKTRNTMDRAVIVEKIKYLERSIESMEDNKEKTVVVQNDAPVVADHKEYRKLTTGDITNSQGAFIGII